MKIQLWLIIMLLSFFEFVDAQELNTPRDFQRIIQDSRFKYTFQEANYFTVNRPILESPPFKVTVYTIDGQRKIQKLIKKANKCFDNQKWEKALDSYLEILVIDKQNTWILHRIAVIYTKQTKFSLAIKTYSNILIINSLDFDAYWKSALIYHQEGLNRQAYRNITKAHLMNRNHPEILKDLKIIYQDLDLVYQDNWQFNFGYNYREVGKDSILLKSKNEPLKAYGICKSVWNFNETYRNLKLADYGDKLDYVEEKECLLNWLIAHEFDKTSIEKSPIDIQLFKESLAQRQENAFIMYEIWSVRQPLIFHTLEKEKLESVMEYLLEIRCIKMKH